MYNMAALIFDSPGRFFTFDDDALSLDTSAMTQAFLDIRKTIKSLVDVTPRRRSSRLSSAPSGEEAKPDQSGEQALPDAAAVDSFQTIRCYVGSHLTV